VYVACLAAYNSGHLHGEWIDADQDADSIMDEIRAMLAESPSPGAEEWAIHDYECFGALPLSEYEDIERVAQLGQLIAEHGLPFAAYAAHVGEDYATEEGFEEAYRGEWDDEEDYAYQLWEDLGYNADIPEHLQCYIDHKSFAHDLFISDCYSIDNPEGGIWVFDNH